VGSTQAKSVLTKFLVLLLIISVVTSIILQIPLTKAVNTGVILAESESQTLPAITSTTAVLPTRTQTIHIYGKGFGNTFPQTVDLGDGSLDTIWSSTTPSIFVHDRGSGSHEWSAGWWAPFYDLIGINLVSWSDSEIVIGGFGSVLGIDGQGTWNIAGGDPVTIMIFTPNGNCSYDLTVEATNTITNSATPTQSLTMPTNSISPSQSPNAQMPQYSIVLLYYVLFLGAIFLTVAGTAYLLGRRRLYSIIININGRGTTKPAPSIKKYKKGTKLTFEAIPDSGWEFDQWSGDAYGKQNPITLTINSNRVITVSFSQTERKRREEREQEEKNNAEKEKTERLKREQQKDERERTEQTWKSEQQRPGKSTWAENERQRERDQAQRIKEEAEKKKQEQQRQTENDQKKRQQEEQAEHERRKQQEHQFTENVLNAYKVLKVSTSAPAGEVKNAWRKCCLNLNKKWKPLQNPQNPIIQEGYKRDFMQVNQAWEDIKKANGWS
jgi:hypothetical protein